MRDRLSAIFTQRRRILAGWALITLLLCGGMLSVGWAAFAEHKRPPAKPCSGKLKDQEAQKAAVVLAEFVRAGVFRQDAESAYNMSGNDIRQGQTYRQWLKSWNDPNEGVPIVPWNHSYAKTHIEASYLVGKPCVIENYVMLISPPGDTMTFIADVVRKPPGPWVVDYWAPMPVVGPPQG